MKSSPLSAALLLLSAAGLSAQPVASKLTPASHQATLLTTFVDWDSLPPRTTPVGLSRAVFDNPTPTLEKFEMHITSLRPGMRSHPVHHHPWEEMLLIKEGDVEVSINGVKHRAGPGYLIFFASHDPHNLTNVGSTLATYYVINFYTDKVHRVADKPASEQNVPGMFASAVIDCDGLKATPTKTGSRVTIVDSPTLTFDRLGSHITTLNPGQGTAADMVDNGDELFVIRQGEVGVAVNGVACRMHAGSFFYCAPNDKRTLRNLGSGPASYQVIKIISARSPKLPGAAS
ncbi:MAG TPA: cupin domain-containing protein [Opitutaceae bacterium]|nr:cupin domain-containing protein [Opitutaceae bacterium]